MVRERPIVLFVTTPKTEDYYYLPFLRQLKQNGQVRPVIFDTTQFPLNAKVVLRVSKTGIVSGSLEVFEYDDTGALQKCIVRIEDVKKAWYVRAREPQTPVYDAEEVNGAFFTQLVRDETAALLQQLFNAAPWEWINPPPLGSLDTNKMGYQVLATKARLPVPPSMGTNDPQALLDFLPAGGHILVKKMAHTAIPPGPNGEEQFISVCTYDRTQLMEPAWQAAVAVCPVFAQHVIAPADSVRFAYIDGEIFAHTLVTATPRLDSRDHATSDQYRPITLPPAICEKVCMLMRLVDRRFSVNEFLVTPEGEYYLHDINQSGQYDTIHRLAGWPIPEAVARMLEA